MGKQVGFIGLGTMGGPMANNLLKDGYLLRVYDINGEAIEAAVASGAAPAGSATFPRQLNPAELSVTNDLASQGWISAFFMVKNIWIFL